MPIDLLRRLRPGSGRSLLLASSLLLSCAVGGCAEDDPFVPPPEPEPEPEEHATFLGRVVDTSNEAPLDSIPVSLYRLDDLRVVDLTRSDADGRFGFHEIEAGDYIPVFHTSYWEMFYMPETRWTLAAGDTVNTEVRLLSVAYAPDEELEPYEIHGLVVDDVTGLPIDGVQVEMTSFVLSSIFETFGLFDGEQNGLQPVTDADGRFYLGPFGLVPSFLTPQEQTASIRFSHPDYLDTWVRGYRPFLVPDSLTMRMTPGLDQGAIVGRVIDPYGNPLEGVSVTADWKRGDGARAKNLSSGSAGTLSGPDGRYRIEGLSPGWYNVRCAALSDDGWFDVPSVAMETGVYLETDADSVGTRDLIAIPAMAVLDPPPNAIVSEPPVLEWEPVEGADSYIIELVRGNGGSYRQIRTAETTYDTSGDSYFSAPILYVWIVTAVDADLITLAVTERRSAWKYQPSDPAKTP